MIKSLTGNLLAITDGIIVHGCNPYPGGEGGLARLIFDKFPRAFNAHEAAMAEVAKVMQIYGRASRDGKVCNCPPMDVALGTTSLAMYDNLTIINAVTQSQPGSGSLSYTAIGDCFDAVRETALILGQSNRPNHIYFPMIGAGIAGGDWSIILPIIEKALQGMPATIVTL
jgi:O-acetyl-ADP-ribose deacetylase (regulator of RNase III)